MDEITKEILNLETIPTTEMYKDQIKALIDFNNKKIFRLRERKMKAAKLMKYLEKDINELREEILYIRKENIELGRELRRLK